MESHLSPGVLFLSLFSSFSLFFSFPRSQCPKLLALGSTSEEIKNYLKSELPLTQRGHPLLSDGFSWALALHTQKTLRRFSPQQESNFLQNMNSSAISLATSTYCSIFVSLQHVFSIIVIILNRGYIQMI